MSEFQYYEWQTVDRVLTAAEQAAVNRLSSHIDVSPGKAVVSYNWGDFRHDPKEVLLKYFDAFFYYANWGSLRLMFRFPKGMLDEKELEPYWDGECVSFETHGEYQVLDIEINPEDGGWMEESVVDLSDFISLRADLLNGDFRLLYLTWLKEMAIYDEYEDEQEEDEDGQPDDLEPPIPAGLSKLSPALETIVEVFDIDPLLVQAAAEASLDLHEKPEIDYRQLIARLSRTECDNFLTRLAAGDAVVGMALRKRLGEFLPHDQPPRAVGKRKLGELLRRAQELGEAEEKRQIEEEREKHLAELNDLAQRENEVWQQIDRLLETGRKIASVYDAATELLESLQDLAEFQGTREIFLSRVQKLAEKFSPRPSLIRRWEQRDWV